MLVEALGEIRGAVESNRIGDFCNRPSVSPKHPEGALESHSPDILRRGDTSQGVELSVQVRVAHRHFPCEILNPEILVAQVRINRLVDAAEKLGIR